ncbi:MAG TPA: cytochrome c3 family protein [Blastocatellia bacterium]|nr:cytochrome c3 family protein [Blastocatellia bacterium]
MTKRTKYIAILIVAALAAGLLLLRVMGKSEAPRQPIEFDHWQHISKPEGPQLDCVFCHEHADKSSHATIPNIETCMICHETEKTDSPEIQKLAAINARGEQPAWRRVYWFESESNVFFTHKPHTRAGVDCSECHGQVGQMHRVSREINQTMGWCIECHKKRGASIDCYICHR